MSKQSSNYTLPPKELSIFKRVVKYYDQKQYKNGLKYAKQILSNPKFSEHGETLAMKGILLNCLGKKDEAREYVKRGLKANITSFVCWHIYGLIHKSDHKYEEAIKCYLQALKLDNENLQVLRDLSVLQMQLRDYEGCRDIRYKLLLLRPSQKASWIGYALIHHLLGNYEIALTVINEFRKGQSETSPFDYEHSELLLYQAMIMVEAGKEKAALEHLDQNSNAIVDKISLLEMKAELNLKLGHYQAAVDCSWSLIDRNQENRSYFELLSHANIALVNGKIDEDFEMTKKTYESIIARYPQSRLSKRLVLNYCSGDEFLQRLDAYLKPYIRKGVPPLFIQLVELFDDPKKLRAFESLLSEYRKNMNVTGYLDAHDNNEREAPTTLVWLNYLSAQYYNFKKEYQEAIDIIDTQLLSTPTLVDFYVLKADVFHDAGDYITASRWMEEAQSLDTADRFINARCTKFMVEAHRLEDATNMASKFTRGNTSPKEYLSEMQCMWFLLDNARALKEMGKLGDALKLCHEVQQHYRNILDDQLDFHSYCLRKVTLRAYVETLRLEDRLRDHQSYFDTAQLAVEVSLALFLQIYLQLYSQPLDSIDESPHGENDGISSSEAKKLRNKQRKAAKRAEAEAARVRAEQERREQAARSRQPVSEEANTDNPTIAENDLDANLLARVKKFLLMLKWISRGMHLANTCDNPWFHECCVRFLLKLHSRGKSNDVVGKVLESEVPKLFSEWPENISFVKEYNEKFYQRNQDTYPHIFRYTLSQCLIDPQHRDSYLSKIPLPSGSFKGVTWQECRTCLDILRRGQWTPLGRCDQSIIEKYRSACHEYFPMANAFLTTAQIDILRRNMAEAASMSAVSGVFITPNDKDQHLDLNTDHDSKLSNELSILSIEPMVNGDLKDSTTWIPQSCKQVTVANKTANVVV
ncbi:N-alpha-acetyltransferase 16, NatA auxiliary subunit [Schistosoma japonicum]|nr:N-alpha-acetyltransferase 16, NatA auxiliary subunit [Schistosoma japonicum]